MIQRSTAKTILSRCRVSVLPDSECLDFANNKSNELLDFDDNELVQEEISTIHLVEKFRISEEVSLARMIKVIYEEHSLYGVVNSYIIDSLLKFNIHINKIIGSQEYLKSCPCCCYHNLPDEDLGAICRVCFWENDYSQTSNRDHGLNGISIEEARVNFYKFGAIKVDFIKYVDPEGKSKFHRSNDSTLR